MLTFTNEKAENMREKNDKLANQMEKGLMELYYSLKNVDKNKTIEDQVEWNK